MADTYGGSPYMSYGGNGDCKQNDGIFGGVFGGDPCLSQNILIFLIVLYMLYTFVYLPSQDKSTEGMTMRERVRVMANRR